MTKRVTKEPAAKKRAKAGTGKGEARRRKELFVLAYIANGGNGQQAASEAGYSSKTAYSAANRMLKDVEIQRLISTNRAQAFEKANKNMELSVERTLREIARIAYADPRKFFKADGSLIPVTELDEDSAAALAGVEVVEMQGGAEVSVEGVRHVPMFLKKVKFWDKGQALEKAMKHLGQYAEDNKQRHGVADMSDEALDAAIAKLEAENKAARVTH